MWRMCQHRHTAYFSQFGGTGMNFMYAKTEVGRLALFPFLCVFTDTMKRSLCIWDRISSQVTSDSVTHVPDGDCLSKEIAQHVKFCVFFSIAWNMSARWEAEMLRDEWQNAEIRWDKHNTPTHFFFLLDCRTKSSRKIRKKRETVASLKGNLEMEMYTVSCSLYSWFYGNVCEGQLLCKHCLYCFLNINADLICDTWQKTDNLSCVLSYISICCVYSSWEYKECVFGKAEFECVLMKDIIARLLPISCHVRRVVKTELLVSEWKVWAHLGSRPGRRSQPATPTVPSCRGGGEEGYTPDKRAKS